jgi:hypothetical protein
LLKFLEAKTPEGKLAYVRPYGLQRDILFQAKDDLIGFGTLVKAKSFDKETESGIAKPNEGDWCQVDASFAKAKSGLYGPTITGDPMNGSWYVIYEKGQWRIDVEATLGWTVDWKALAIQRPKTPSVAREVLYLEPTAQYTNEFPESKYLEVRTKGKVGLLKFYVERGSEAYREIWETLKNGDARRFTIVVKFPEKETFFKKEVQIVAALRGWVLSPEAYSPQAVIELPSRDAKEAQGRAKKDSKGDEE